MPRRIHPQSQTQIREKSCPHQSSNRGTVRVAFSRLRGCFRFGHCVQRGDLPSANRNVILLCCYPEFFVGWIRVAVPRVLMIVPRGHFCNPLHLGRSIHLPTPGVPNNSLASAVNPFVWCPIEAPTRPSPETAALWIRTMDMPCRPALCFRVASIARGPNTEIYL